jgi:hypothetical protein
MVPPAKNVNPPEAAVPAPQPTVLKKFFTKEGFKVNKFTMVLPLLPRVFMPRIRVIILPAATKIGAKDFHPHVLQLKTLLPR